MKTKYDIGQLVYEIEGLYSGKIIELTIREDKRIHYIIEVITRPQGSFITKILRLEKDLSDKKPLPKPKFEIGDMLKSKSWSCYCEAKGVKLTEDDTFYMYLLDDTWYREDLLIKE